MERRDGSCGAEITRFPTAAPPMCRSSGWLLDGPEFHFQQALADIGPVDRRHACERRLAADALHCGTRAHTGSAAYGAVSRAIAPTLDLQKRAETPMRRSIRA